MARTSRQSGGRGRLVLLIVLIIAGAGGIAGYRAYRAKATPQVKAVQLWTCPMHPSVIRDHPGTCPICGMTLVPLEETKPRVPSQVAEHGVVEIAPDKQQLIGVVTTRAEMRDLNTQVRAVGQVVVNEQRLSDVHTKVEGFIEKLYVNQTGQLVRKGQPLLSIYSPDLVSTQEEYLVALRSRERTKDSPFAEVQKSGDSMVAAARRRLELWDIPDAEIARLERTGQAKKALTLYAPSAGYVMEKTVVEGMQVAPEMTLFRLADLSRVWVEVSVYEYEAPLVRVGDRATMTTASQPGRKLEGLVTYLYPTVETMTRTLKARLEFANPGLLLKPGMYGDVTIEAPSGMALAIPEQAVLDTGTRKIVYVKQGEGTFMPREVTVGTRAAGYYPVLSGLSAGEEVVSSPGFLVDSESRLQAAIQQKQQAAPVAPAGEAPAQSGAVGGHAGH